MATFTKEDLPKWPVLPLDCQDRPFAPRVADIRVGMVAFYEDPNVRVYLAEKLSPGQRLSVAAQLLPRYHWRAVAVTGETRQSWICATHGSARKFLKKSDPPLLVGKLDVEDYLWLRVNRYRVGEAVQRCADIGKLQEIARIVGYSEEGKENVDG